MNIKIVELTNFPRYLTRWVSWLNDKDVVNFSAKKNKQHTISSQKKFLKKKLNSKNVKIFKIFYRKKFVGVLELSQINKFDLSCNISYMIGEKKLWGKNIATTAIKHANIHAKKIGIKFVKAAINKNNKASKKVLIKNNFKQKNLKKMKNILFFEKKLDLIKL